MSSINAGNSQPCFVSILTPEQIQNMQETAGTPDKLLDDLSFTSRKMVIAVRHVLDKMNIQWRSEECQIT
ncbi:hypothetical protein F1737_08915 [Methanoplanus sp. FWC-SCC4]|uniref:Uncharacterized protein n=1 Tax=Methanochimaera problematica TaxID=2609417 RepID=A0AA97I2Y9_9EURY|nr:hypothetical protein [Methanoplanus sp. FWC-SCC4]WOF16800.1 hypothetical protein F1737_08915 [Methanoplanus sp. FWC-SCC4]